MLIDKLLQAAKPYTQNRTIKDLVVGISLIAVQLDDDSVGVSYVLREDLPGGCSVFPYAREMIGVSAAQIADWAAEGRDNIQRAIGNAVLNAASTQQDLPDCSQEGKPFGLHLTGGEKVGMIGMIQPAVMMLKPYNCQMYMFDKGREGQDGIYPAERQAELLPQCQVVFSKRHHNYQWNHRSAAPLVRAGQPHRYARIQHAHVSARIQGHASGYSGRKLVGWHQEKRNLSLDIPGIWYRWAETLYDQEECKSKTVNLRLRGPSIPTGRACLEPKIGKLLRNLAIFTQSCGFAGSRLAKKKGFLRYGQFKGGAIVEKCVNFA